MHNAGLILRAAARAVCLIEDCGRNSPYVVVFFLGWET